MAVQEMDAAHYHVLASEHRREIINAIGIAFLRDNAVKLRHSLWMPHDGCDLVTPLCKLGKNSRSGIASGSDQRNPHRLPPASELPLVSFDVVCGDDWQRMVTQH
jgi:hypothetical protein